jgi:hypothetical protein
MFSQIGQQERGRESDPKPEKINLVEKAQTHDDPQENPETGAAAVYDKDEQIGGQGPEDVGEGVHLEDAGVADDDRRKGHGQAGQGDGRPPSAETPGDEAAEEDGQGVGEGG